MSEQAGEAFPKKDVVVGEGARAEVQEPSVVKADEGLWKRRPPRNDASSRHTRQLVCPFMTRDASVTNIGFAYLTDIASPSLRL